MDYCKEPELQNEKSDTSRSRLPVCPSCLSNARLRFARKEAFWVTEKTRDFVQEPRSDPAFSTLTPTSPLPPVRTSSC